MFEHCVTDVFNPFYLPIEIMLIEFWRRREDITPWIFFEFASPVGSQFILDFCQFMLFWTRTKECKFKDKSWSSSNSSSSNTDSSPFSSKKEIRFFTVSILLVKFCECWWCHSFRLNFIILNFFHNTKPCQPSTLKEPKVLRTKSSHPEKSAQHLSMRNRRGPQLSSTTWSNKGTWSERPWWWATWIQLGHISHHFSDN